MTDRVGQRLGNYRLVRKIGQGGFAEVYLGQHIYLDTFAAIKVLHARLESDDVEYFLTEARTVARLLHPNIVRVLEFNVEDTTPFLVVDYAPNGTLRKRHARGIPLPPTTIVSYTRQVASALEYAHEQKVIHRDVKPENMLVGRRNEILLSDFGIAVVSHSSRYSSGAQGIQDMAGTVAYMAPEQIQSQACPNSDQYSLGVVVYEWLCGTRPFQGSFAEIAVKHTLTPPPSLLERVPELPPAVEEVVLKALAKDPQQRFENVQVFALALEKAFGKGLASTYVFPDVPSTETQTSSPSNTIVLSNPETFEESFATVQSLPPDLVPSPPTTSKLNEQSALQQPKTTSLPSQIQDSRISRRGVVIGLSSLALVGLVGGGVALLTHLQMPSNHVQMQTQHIFTYTGHTDWVWSVAWSPDGKSIASAGGDKTVQVWNSADGQHMYTYRGHTGNVYSVAWSPDGRLIASASSDGTVQIWFPSNGNLLHTIRLYNTTMWSVAWSPDGKRIAAGSNSNTIQVWNATDGSYQFILGGHTDFVYSVAWSPNGKYIASASGDKTVRIWDASNGHHISTYTGHTDSVRSVSWASDSKRLASASWDKTVQVWQMQ